MTHPPLRPRLWLLFLLLSLATGARAELRLQLEDHGLEAAQRQASRQLLDSAQALLPPAFVERLDQRIRVRWTRLPDAVHGRLVGDRLLLNQALLAGLVDGSASQERTGRTHGTRYRELLATVLHELAHRYDRARLWSPPERRQLARCARLADTLGLVGLPDTCRGQTTRRFTLSDDPRLLELAGWPQRIGGRGEPVSENGLRERSPDPYELHNPREFLAVNFEYFLLDPTYACRRPALHQYFQAHFTWQPPRAEPCSPRLPYLNASRDYEKAPLAWIDPERVYEVDYLYAEANDNWVSRWGHSMLRLVICAPGRPRGADCRLDLDHHLVLSFRAFVGDLQLSSWDGLTGEYPSRLFILPLAQVVDEYTKVELRDLLSVPLRLDQASRDALVRRAVEMHWSYDGRYYFLTNNCAVETLQLLRTGTDHPALRGLDSVMPNALLDSLIARGLADPSPLADSREALRLGYRFDSFRARYQAMFSVLRQQLPISQRTVEEWLALPADHRQPWIARADLRTSAALLLLEQAAQRQQLLLAQDELKQRYLSGAADPRMQRTGEMLQSMLVQAGFLSRPAELLQSGYGLPLPAEWQELSSLSEERHRYLRRLSDTLDQDLRQLLLPQRRHELAAVESNLAQLGERVRELHRQSGGLRLESGTR